MASLNHLIAKKKIKEKSVLIIVSLSLKLIFKYFKNDLLQSKKLSLTVVDIAM